MDNLGYEPDQKGTSFAIPRHSEHPPPENRYLVEVTSRRKILKKRNFYKSLSLVLLVFLFLTFFMLLTIAILYFRSSNPIGICESSECLRFAANLRYSMDFDVDPCEDFYQYVCGHWSNSHLNHKWFISNSPFSEITEQLLIRIEAFLKHGLDDERNSSLAIRHSRNLYRSCVDQDSIDRLGISVIYKYLESVGLPHIPAFLNTNKSGDEETFNWIEREAGIKTVFGSDVFIGVLPSNNIYNTSEYVLYLGTPYRNSILPTPIRKSKTKFGIFNRLFQKPKDEDDNDEFGDFTDEYNKVLIKLVISLVVEDVIGEIPDNPILDEATDILIAIANNLTDLIGNYSDTNTGDTIVAVPYKFDEIQQLTEYYLISQNGNNDSIEAISNVWRNYLGTIFDRFNLTLLTDTVFVFDDEISYLPKIIEYIQSVPDLHLELYMWYDTVLKMVLTVSSDISDFLLSEFLKIDRDTVLLTKSLICAGHVDTYLALAVALGTTDRNRSQNLIPKIERMTKNIQNAFEQRVHSLDWLDERTKLAAIRKSQQINRFLGHPEWLFKMDVVDKTFERIQIEPDAFLDNIMNIINDYGRSVFKMVGTTVRPDWQLELTSINAVYSYDYNAINVPIGIIAYPLYDLGLEALHYGSMGAIISHELIHGFDDNGRKRDEFGNYKSWWTNQTNQIFMDKTQCFIKQYGNYSIKGLNASINGLETLSENLADNGGLRIALEAYKNLIKETGPEQFLPSFERFTHLQLVFISYASIWCQSLSPTHTKWIIDNDQHAPNSIRVLGTLQNSEAFSEAFQCPSGTGMNPFRTKCTIW